MRSSLFRAPQHDVLERLNGSVRRLSWRLSLEVQDTTGGGGGACPARLPTLLRASRSPEAAPRGARRPAVPRPRFVGVPRFVGEPRFVGVPACGSSAGRERPSDSAPLRTLPAPADGGVPLPQAVDRHARAGELARRARLLPAAEGGARRAADFLSGISVVSSLAPGGLVRGFMCTLSRSRDAAQVDVDDAFS